MTNNDIQRKLLKKTRTAYQVLQFALNRERGQKNQTQLNRIKQINTQLNRNPLNTFEQISNIMPSQRSQAYKPRPRFPARNPQPQRNFNTPNPCRRCGLQFTQEHLLICPARKVQCNLCKKWDTIAKLIWQIQQIRPQQNVSQQNIPQTRRVRNTRPTPDQQQIPTQNQDTHSETNNENIELENTFFIQELFDSWNTVNLIKPKTFHNAQPHKLSPNISGEIWIKTTSDMTEIDRLEDTGSLRSFVCKAEAKKNFQQCKSAKWKDPTGWLTKYRCFNNIEIPIAGTIQLKRSAGHREAANNEILVVDANSVNLLGRDILGKRGFTLSQSKATYMNNIHSENAMQIKIMNRFPHLCSRLGKFENHIAKSTLKQDIAPYLHKGRRVPLHLTDKVDKKFDTYWTRNK